MKPSHILIWFQFFLFSLPPVKPVHAQTWRLAPGTFGNGAGAIAFYPQNPDTVFALGVYWSMLSTNGGETWDSLNNFGFSQGSIAVNPTDPNKILFISGAGNNTNLNRSTDGGVSWVHVFNGFLFPGNFIEHDPLNSQKVYVGLGPNRIRSSPDFGETWDTLGYPPETDYLNSFSISQTDPSFMYLGRPGSIVKSTDGGETWFDISPFSFGSGSIVRVNPENDSIVYAGIYSVGSTVGGMYKSTNGGTDWFEINSGLSSSKREIKKILINPSWPDEIFVGLRDTEHILYRTTDAGMNWHPFDNGLPRSGDVSGVQSISIDTLNHRIFVGAGTSSPGDSIGIYYLDLATGVSTDEERQQPTFALGQNYPNPFNASTNINFSLSFAGRVNLKVYDLLGREVAVLASGFMESGSHVVTFDGSSLASGLYFYRLEASGFVQTKRLLLLR